MIAVTPLFSQLGTLFECVRRRKPCNTLNLNELGSGYFYATHLSKGSSGRKQKCTQFLTPFSGTVFHALSLGLIHFKNLKMEVFDWLLKNFNQQVVSQANTPNKMDHTM